MGGKITGAGIVGALITAVAVAAAVYTGGASLSAAAAWGAGAGAASLVATSMLSQMPGITPHTDSATTLSRSTSPQSGIPILYGEKVKCGSIVNWYNVQNNSSQYLFTSHALAMGEINKVSQIWLDDEPVLTTPVTVEGVVPNTSIDAKYRDILQLEVYFGKPNYTAGKVLAGTYGGSQWNNTTFKGNGIVQIYTVIKKTQKSLEDNLLVNDNYVLTAECSGKKIYDLVSGTTIVSNNPVNQLYDYVTNTEYGLGVSPGNIDIASFQTAAQYCTRYQMYSNGAIDYQSTYKSNIEKMLMTFGGITSIHCGKLYLTVDIPALSVQTFDESTIFGEFVSTTSGISDYFNTIDATWKNTTNNYSDDILRIPSDIPASDVLTSDGLIIAKSLDYSWVYDKDQVEHLINIELLKGKYSHNTISFNTDSGWDIAVWDVITVNFPEHGYENKLFRVAGKSISTNTDSIGMVQLQCVEYHQGIYEGVDVPMYGWEGTLPKPVAVLPPSNLTVVKKGATNQGQTVVLSWSASIDQYLRGYYVYYRQTGTQTWTYGGSTNQYVLSYELYGLTTGVQYDFAVAAFNNLGIVSDKVTQNGVVPDFAFTLPAITGLNLINRGSTANTTDALDFIIGWDDQSNVNVNGKKFSEYFNKYEIIVYDTGMVKKRSYFIQANQFTYTYAMNKLDTLSRTRTFGVVAWGHNSSIYSAEARITVTNPQCPALTGFTANAGYESIFVAYNSPEASATDFAGVLVQVATNSTFTQNLKAFGTNSPFMHSFPIADGKYYVRAGAYDEFGQDSIIYTAGVYVDLQSRVNWSAQDEQSLNDFLQLDDKISTAIDDAVAQANINTTTKIGASETKTTKLITDGDKVNATAITNLQATTAADLSAQVTTLNKAITDGDKANATSITQLTSKTATDISAAVTTLNQTITTKDTAQTQALNAQVSSINSNITSQVATLNSTITSKDTAQSTALTQAKSELNGSISSVSTAMTTNIDALKNTVNSHYELKVNANGTIAGMGIYADANTKASAVYFVADDFKIITAKTSGAVSNPVIPFAVQNNTVYINSAMIANASIGQAHIADASISNAKIQDGSINNAKIGYQISSNNWNDAWPSDGGQGWCIRKDGTSYFNNGYFRGSVFADSGYFRGDVYAENGYFKGTVYASGGSFTNGTFVNCTIDNLKANSIQGDIMRMFLLGAGGITIPAESQFARILTIPCIPVTVKGGYDGTFTPPRETTNTRAVSVYANGSILGGANISARGLESDISVGSVSMTIPAGVAVTLTIQLRSNGNLITYNGPDLTVIVGRA